MLDSSSLWKDGKITPRARNRIDTGRFLLFKLWNEMGRFFREIYVIYVNALKRWNRVINKGSVRAFSFDSAPRSLVSHAVSIKLGQVGDSETETITMR
jgi:hypothetical protein